MRGSQDRLLYVTDEGCAAGSGDSERLSYETSLGGRKGPFSSRGPPQRSQQDIILQQRPSRIDHNANLVEKKKLKAVELRWCQESRAEIRKPIAVDRSYWVNENALSDVIDFVTDGPSLVISPRVYDFLGRRRCRLRVQWF